MAKKSATKRPQNGKRTIILPITQEQYDKIINDPKAFREEWLAPNYANHPELFPAGFEKGYEMKGHYHAKRQGIVIRRIALRNGTKYQVRPSFVLPMMVGRIDEVEGGLLMRKFGVPYWAIARAFGRNATFWYRLETSIGRNSIVGTTVKTEDIPIHLVADEHHEKLNGEKVYIATTVGAGCILGAEVSASASGDDLQKA